MMLEDGKVFVSVKKGKDAGAGCGLFESAESL
jgi:hypothetical protein